MISLEAFKENIIKRRYGRTIQEAHFLGICIDCGKPALQNCYSEAGKREYGISGLCEKCFDKLAA
jgi:hypothetical protein